MGRRKKTDPNKVVPLLKAIEEIVHEWVYEDYRLQARYVAAGAGHGCHVRIVKTGRTFDREIARVFLGNGYAKKDLEIFGNAAFELTFPPDDNEEHEEKNDQD